MPKSFFPAAMVVVALAFSSVPAAVLAAEPTPSAAKALLPVQEAVKAKRWNEVIEKAPAALAAGKTPYDAYLVYNWLAAAYQAQNNRAELLNALQKQLDTGYPQPAEQNRTIRIMATIAHQMKNYPQAQELGNRLIRNGAADADTYDMVGDSLAQQGKNAEAAKFLSDYVAEQERNGKKPSEQTLTRLLALYRKVGNTAGVSDIQEKLVVNYRKPEYWEALLYQLSRGSKMTDRQSLQVFRLKMATGTMKRCQDFGEMEEMAMAAGMPGESQKVIEQALAAKACTVKSDEDRLRRHLNTNNNVLAEDKARFAKLEADARVSKIGEQDVAVGLQLFGYGEYAKAAESLSRGIAKGGLKSTADAQLTLATAQYRANNKAEALKILRSIKADDPVTQRIVKLWLIYAQ